MNGGQGRPPLPNPKKTQLDIDNGKQKQLFAFFPPAIKDSAVQAACLSMEKFFQGRHPFANVLKAMKVAVPPKGTDIKYHILTLTDKELTLSGESLIEQANGMFDAMMKELEMHPAKYDVLFLTEESLASNPRGPPICPSLASHQENLMSVFSSATSSEFQNWLSVDGITVDLYRMIK